VAFFAGRNFGGSEHVERVASLRLSARQQLSSLQVELASSHACEEGGPFRRCEVMRRQTYVLAIPEGDAAIGKATDFDTAPGAGERALAKTVVSNHCVPFAEGASF
jgi:hypothetical protein